MWGFPQSPAPCYSIRPQGKKSDFNIISSFSTPFQESCPLTVIWIRTSYVKSNDPHSNVCVCTFAVHCGPLCVHCMISKVHSRSLSNYPTQKHPYLLDDMYKIKIETLCTCLSKYIYLERQVLSPVIKSTRAPDQLKPLTHFPSSLLPPRAPIPPLPPQSSLRLPLSLSRWITWWTQRREQLGPRRISAAAMLALHKTPLHGCC